MSDPSASVPAPSETIAPDAPAAVPWYRALGPGILLAGAAIGGSHLVWSSRAGALYGWSLIWAIVLINVLKYPFFRYAQRYTAATGHSLLHGYRRLGRGWLWLFLVVSLPLSVVIIAAVGLLAAVLIATGVLGLKADVPETIALAKHLTLGLGVACTALVAFGCYRWLDRVVKAVIVVLAITTLLAAVLAAVGERPAAVEVVAQPLTLAFVVSLMGWMPAPIDITAWSSLWMLGKAEDEGRRIGVREAMFDFNVGYVGTALLALVFLAMGALLVFGSGASVPGTGIGFTRQLLQMYTDAIGGWAFWIVLACMVATMVSTTLTCIDGYGRSCAVSIGLLRGQADRLPRGWHVGLMAAMSLAAALLIYLAIGNLLDLLKIAAVISFLTSPLYGLLNLLAMRDPAIPPACRPGRAMVVFSWLSLVVMTGLGIAFVITLL